MPKSWSFRASIATFIAEMMTENARFWGLRARRARGLPIPPRPVEAVLVPDVANGAWIDAVAARELRALVHPLSDLVRHPLDAVEPAETVVRVVLSDANAIGEIQREPDPLAARRHSARDARGRVAL